MHRRRYPTALILLAASATATVAATGLATGSPAASAPTSAAADVDPRTWTWVEQLGSADPAVWKPAEDKLVEAGRAAVPALRAVADAADATADSVDGPTPAARAAARRTLRIIAIRFVHPPAPATKAEGDRYDQAIRTAVKYLAGPTADDRRLTIAKAKYAETFKGNGDQSAGGNQFTPQQQGSGQRPPGVPAAPDRTLTWPPPTAILVDLFLVEPDATLRRQLWAEMNQGNATGYRDGVMALIAADDEEGVGTVVAAAVAYGDGLRAASADYAAWAQLTGRADAARAQFAAELTNATAPNSRRRPAAGDADDVPTKVAAAAGVLTALDRLAGRFDAAAAVASKTGDPAWLPMIADDDGDWKTLAATSADRGNGMPGVALAYKAAYLRLAGDFAGAAKASADLLAAVPEPPPDEPVVNNGDGPPAVQRQANDEPYMYAPGKLLMLTDQPARGIQLITAAHPVAAFNLLKLRGQYAEALALAKRHSGAVDMTDATHPRRMSDARNDLLQLLGERDGPDEADDDNEIAEYPAAVVLLQRKDYRAAAAAFAKLYEDHPKTVVFLYLQGYATAAAGDVAAGKAMMSRATLAPLGNPFDRAALAGPLPRAGLPEEGEREMDLALRTGSDADEFGFSSVYFDRIEDLSLRRQWAAAATAADHLVLTNVSPGNFWGYYFPDQFLISAAAAHRLHARALAEAGDMAGANREIALVERYFPDDMELALEWVPWYDAHGFHTAADALFDRAYGAMNKASTLYPKSAHLHNQLAWLAACCCRRTAEAVAHAEAAAKLRPNDWQYLDTLAEARFRNGDRRGAATTERRAKTLAPAGRVLVQEYIDRQLKRFADSPVPSTTQPVEEPKEVQIQ